MVVVRTCVLFTLAFLCTGAFALSLHKRDAPLATVNIPLTINKDQRYVVGVNMSSSPVQQSFKFALAANTGYTAVAGVACDSCDGVPTYNASASSSQNPFPGSANVSIGASSLSGPFIKENCSLHEANGTAWNYPNQTIITANSSSSLFSDVTSGLIGLGTNANGLSGDFFDTVFGQWLIRNPSRNNFTFGMSLKPPTFTSDEDEGNGGLLHWIVPDSSAYEGNVSWMTASVSSAPSSSQNVSDTSSNVGFVLPDNDWSIDLDGWSASISSTVVANSSKAQALIEPFFSDIIFPASQANLFYAAIPSAAQISSFVRAAQAWTIPCDTSLSVAFTFAGQSFPLDPSQLVEKQSDGTCIGTIKAWPDSTITNFLFGSNFISAVYLIFVIGRPGSGVPNSVGMAPRASSSSSKPVGAIVGGTVGGVVFVTILLVGAYILGRRHRSKRTASTSQLSSSKAEEKDKFVLNHNKDEASDEGGAQYAISSLPHYGPIKHSPTTPSTVRSTRPLLPEAQSPHSPAFSVPSSPYTPIDFLAMSTGTSHSGHAGDLSSASVGSHISYNAHALGANMTASRSVLPSGVDAGGRTVTVEPFMLPPASSPSGGAPNQKFTSDNSRPQTAQSSLVHQVNDNNNVSSPTSPQDIDPFSPSTASAATVTPFVLGPAPQATALRSGRKGAGPTRRGVVDSPAPPYTEQAHDAVSPTLVDYSQDPVPSQASQQQEKAR